MLIEADTGAMIVWGLALLVLCQACFRLGRYFQRLRKKGTQMSTSDVVLESAGWEFVDCEFRVNSQDGFEALPGMIFVNCVSREGTDANN